MRFFAVALLSIAAYATTPSPTVPTPFPTQTPAPESLCTYVTGDQGPFPLDCLQAEFINAGCSMRGDDYPTNTALSTNDKYAYNQMTWDVVLSTMAAIKTAGGTPCLGAVTPNPTTEPTMSPTTLPPSPAPTLPPTSLTPAPTYGAYASWTNIGSSDGTTTDNLFDACVAKGFMREYDDSNYVLRLTMNGYVDYYTAASGEICDLVNDPTNGQLMWSDRHNGPFQPMTVADSETFSYFGTTTGPDGRAFASWKAASGTGGFGSTDPANGNLGALAGQAFDLAVSTLRMNEPCRERMSPLLTNTFDSPSFSSPCQRAGTTGQVWDETAPVCDGTSNMDLLYAIANRQMATCDSLCVYGMDYDDSQVPAVGEYWFWNAAAGQNCWKRPSEYFASEFKYCDPNDAGFNQSQNDQAHYDWAMVERNLLCKERCDMADGWVYAMGSCYRVAQNAEYMNLAANGNPAKGLAFCQSTLPAGSTAYQASINSASENAVANTLCLQTNECYFGAMTGVGQGSGAWDDGTHVTWTNWQTNESTERSKGNSMVMLMDGTWSYYYKGRAIGVLCEAAAETDDADMLKDTAETCALDATTAAAQLLNTSSFPSLDVAASGFTDPTMPGDLHVVVNVPKTMYGIDISFENSTNDEADYNWAWANSVWALSGDDGTCAGQYVIEGTIPWALFNLGGAGGVERLATWEDNIATTPIGGNVRNTQDQLQADGSGVYYQFGSTVRVMATQPIYTSVHDHTGAARLKREARMDREVTVRVPFILRFQKTITVTTDVNIVSTKYNYKTVAAIIQSIQHSTQYFSPPYAKIQMQIRTKSQYPYLFNNDATLANLHVATTGNNPNTPGVPGVPVQLDLEWLSDDVNCTFTNSDHMREGDICTQEWLLHITPEDNVCYATGEYSVELLTDCFYGKDVCYLPVDSNGNDIDTVTFTFKVQTSKFCPELADEVDLTGSMVVTGRESFKPSVEGKEAATNGQFYMQGETIHVFATTDSQKAKIVDTKIAMVELVQDFTALVQTGYNRVPYDATFADKTIWMRNPSGSNSPQYVRVADGTVTVDDGQTSTPGIVLMEDAGVYGTGDDPCTAVSCTFTAKEAGFKFNLHSRAMPVNVDSFGSKTLIATLEVTYEALDGSNGMNVNTIGRRRRLLQKNPSFDMRSSVQFPMRAWQPQSVPKGLGATASMALEITLSSKVDRTNVLSFSQAVHTAIVQSLNADGMTTLCYDEQVSVDQIFSDGVSLWKRPQQGQLASRRLLANLAQRITVEFTFANSDMANSMALTDMVASFDKQLRNPGSPLLNQPLFAGAVVHNLKEITLSTYVAPTQSQLASSAFVAVPSLFALLALLW